MNYPDTEMQRAQGLRRGVAWFALGLAGATAGVSLLAPLVTPILPNPLGALLGAILVTGLCVPPLWLRVSRRLGPAIPPERLGAEAIVHQTAEGILVVNRRGHVLWLNPAAERLFGYRSAEVRNQPVILLVTDPPSHETPHVLQDSLPVGTILGLAAGAREVVGKHKNGDTFPLELMASTVAYGEEDVSVVFARDVSKRKQAQRYLTAHYAATCVLAEAPSLSEALPRILQAVCEALRCDLGAYWRWDADAKALVCADLYQAPYAALPPVPDAGALTCRPDQGLCGPVWSAGKPIWVEDLQENQAASCAAALVPLKLKGAFAIPILMGQEVRGVLTFFSHRRMRRDDHLLGIMAQLGKQIGQFIARKQDEEKLRQTTQTLQALVHAAPLAICIIDLEDRVRLWNPAAERLLHWTESETLGQALPFCSGEELDGVAENPARSTRGRSCHGLSSPCRRKDGAWIEVSLSAAPLHDAQGSIFGTVLMLMDLTEQKRLENQLRQAQKMEAVGQLAGGVAHDFNNLLTIITGYTDLMLLDADLDGRPCEHLAEIKGAADRAAALTRQLLAFGRKQTFQVQVLDLNNLVREVEKMLRRLIGENIEVALEQDPVLGRVRADRVQIEQVLLNLAINARDAMPQGGRLVITTANVRLDEGWTRTRPEVVPGPYVELAVRDTGCGMDATTRARVFEPFFTTKDVGKGTGLGLATVYGIVKQSGGHIELDSAVGRGTTFRMYLPRLASTVSALRPPAPPVKMPQGNETVLLVEDEDNVRKLMQHSLRMNGYRVLEAKSGREALKLCEQHRGDIDLLVTDVIMPHMNGRQLAERAVQLQPDLGVLYMSGYTDNVLENQGVLASGIELLQKPVLPTVLAQKVREVLDRGRDQQAPARAREGEPLAV